MNTEKLSAIGLPLTDATHFSEYIFDGAIREIMAFKFNEDCYVGRWDSVKNGRRITFTVEAPKLHPDEVFEYLKSKRQFVLNLFLEM